MNTYYNEIDSFAAQWLRNLIVAGHIAPGEVDERSIEDVQPDDLRGFTQCHFFAGIGVWSYALRLAGWPDERPVWTASCPCQPLSAAGKGLGFADERHLWPAFHHLAAALRPPILIGEQVASKAADEWIDLVQADVEALDYTFGCVPFPAASLGAPHIRDRNYWVAHASGEGQGGRRVQRPRESDGAGPGSACERSSGLRAVGGLAHHHHQGLEGRGQPGCERAPERLVGAGSLAGGVADEPTDGRREERQDARGVAVGDCSQGLTAGPRSSSSNLRSGPTNGFWRDVDWLRCRDGKWRPVEPGTFPLANGAASRVGRLRAYGNAIVAEAAEEFIAAVDNALVWQELLAA